MKHILFTIIVWSVAFLKAPQYIEQMAYKETSTYERSILATLYILGTAFYEDPEYRREIEPHQVSKAISHIVLFPHAMRYQFCESSNTVTFGIQNVMYSSYKRSDFSNIIGLPKCFYGVGDARYFSEDLKAFLRARN